MDFSDEITYWYRQNKRNLPWRSENDPYYIWLSEIILQQTRVDQGLPYYLKFKEELPDIQSFANASEDKILKLWQGLGYYSRARNMHHAAKNIVANYNSRFPETYDELLKLKGVGEYTAAAIASFCYNLPHPVIDGNVYRVLSRYFGLTKPIDSTEGKKEFKKVAHEVMDISNPGEYNQAIMEFGALHCTPQNPNCDTCPLATSCHALNNNIINELPVKSKKVKQKTLYYSYLVFIKDGKTFIRKRDDKGIWKNMYEFPFIETKKDATLTQITTSDIVSNINGGKAINVDKTSVKAKHVLSHRIIQATFWKIYLQPQHFINNSDIFEVSIGQLKTDHALPRLIDRYCDENLEGYK